MVLLYGRQNARDTQDEVSVDADGGWRGAEQTIDGWDGNHERFEHLEALSNPTAGLARVRQRPSATRSVARASAQESIPTL